MAREMVFITPQNETAVLSHDARANIVKAIGFLFEALELPEEEAQRIIDDICRVEYENRT